MIPYIFKHAALNTRIHGSLSVLKLENAVWNKFRFLKNLVCLTNFLYEILENIHRSLEKEILKQQRGSH